MPAPPTQPSPESSDSLSVAREKLREVFGYPDFRAPQIPAVQAVVSGADALLVLPTGGGKSLCYQVPALVRGGLTVVVSPLISLMKDQVDALERRGVAAAFLNSTASPEDVAARLARARDGTLKLLYLAPERLDHGRTLQQLVAIGVSLLAVDEAHCISEWGHDFRPSYRRIGMIRERLGSPQTVALTATATPHVQRDIIRQLALQNPAVVVGGFDRTNLTYGVIPTRTQAEKDRAAVQMLRGTDAPAIVYTPTRRAVERMTSVLVRGRIHAVAYHGGLDHALRQRTQDAFMQGRARVIVATSAFGMGIDKPDVRLVVHHAMPNSLEAYYQEAGRAGRDGEASTCVLLHACPDRLTHEFFIGNAHPNRSTIEATWHMLQAHADIDGFVEGNLERLAQQLPKVGEQRLGASLRVLIAAGACQVQQADVDRIWIRLLATPTRIRKELQGRRSSDRQLLRSLWRVAGDRLEQGADVNLRALPSAFGRPTTLIPVLERLETEQFVTWSTRGAGVWLDPRCHRVAVPEVNWRKLARRRASDLARLDAMQNYAQTRYCRRAFVLRYFGVTEVRSQCGACDRCLGADERLLLGSTGIPVRTMSRPRTL